MQTPTCRRGALTLSGNKEDAVESLDLQGTYREKILTLGDAFKNFKSLRSLDLSRNLIVRLQGIEYLHALRSLNLYYNDIESLEEIERLRLLAHLQTLDLRLNPVTRQDTDYRLIVIRTLSNLEILDERPVRDSERKNAKFNFGLKDYKTKGIPEEEIGSIEKNNSFIQKTTAKAHLDFNMSNTDFSKLNDRENDPTDYMKRISPSKYQTADLQSFVQPQSEFEDGIEYRPLPSPTRSSLRSPGPSSRGKEGHRVTFAESTISELFPKKEDLARHLEKEDNLTSVPKPTSTSSDTPASMFDFKYTYLTSTPVRKEFTSSERMKVDACAHNDIRGSTESRDSLKPPEESNRDRLLRLSSDLYVTTHLTDPATSSNSLSSLRKGFTDISKTYALPSKPTLANTHLSTGKSFSHRQYTRDYENSWSPDRPRSIKFDSLSVPQNGMKRASSLNSLLSPKVSSVHQESHNDDALSGNELKKKDSSLSSNVPSINDILHQLIDLVDRYWNGSGSLLQNQRFLRPAQDLLSRLTSVKQTSYVDSAVSPGQDEDSKTTDSVRLKLIKVMEENHFLRTKVYKLENQTARNEGSWGPSLPQDDLRQKYEQLSLQVESLQQQLEKSNKLQETVSLLHNSQRSLVCTNEYLLQQLNKVFPTVISKPPRGTSPDRTRITEYLYSEPSDPSTPSHSAGHYRTPERLSVCPL
ncbi:leucine-rich repeat-containing protein 36-like isoform X2 [Hyla sarda]|uniref:leucine-rich repeat-containing protein 36-like isoform X2 n=1 Tax=Hyla sarda TaxID=327740 RepID=UPI0024C2D7BB|nr:leucine-rich repeat-containing protein 36-like isoform X2 [Hyla sarda]